MDSTPPISEPSQISAKSVAPALAAAAVGLLVGSRMRESTARDVLAAGFAVGALAAGVPLLVEWIRRDYYVDPASKLGAKRHLDRIRRSDGGVGPAIGQGEVYDDELAQHYRS